MLKFSNISFFYKTGSSRNTIFENLTVEFEKSKVCALLGPSGSGKSTILNLIAGVIHPKAGKIDYPKEKRSSIGYVFQQPSLIPWRTVLENARLGIEIDEPRSLNNSSDRIEEFLIDYKLWDFRNSYPSELSGGMQQRVSIIRAVVSGAEILLLDEPFANTDYLLRQELQEDLSEIVSRENLIAVFVTHSLEEAVRLGDKIIVLSGRPAVITCEFEIDIPREQRLKMEFQELAPYIDKVKEGFEKSLKDAS